MSAGLLTMLLGSPNSDIYPWALSSALSQHRLWDPSRALRQDVDALEKLRHDPIVGHGVYFRKLLASGTSWYLEPGGKSKADRAAAGLVQSWLNQLQGFTTLRFNLSEAIFAGSAWARVHIEEREIVTPLGEGVRWIVPVDAQAADKRRFRQLRVDHEPSTVARRWRDREGVEVSQDVVKQNVDYPWQVWEPLQQRWTDAAAYDEDGGIWIQHVVDDNEASLGYGNGLADDLVTYSWAKGQILQYTLNWCERWGSGGFIVAKIQALMQGVMAGASFAARRDQVLGELKKMRSEHVFGIAKEDEVTVLEPNASNVAFVLDFMRYLDSCLTRRTLFADLPTGGGTGAGSNARAQEEGDSTEVAMLHDRAQLDESITRDLIQALWEWNFDRLPAELRVACVPKFSLKTRKKKDSSKRTADVIALLAAGVPLKKEEVYEEIEFSMPTEEDDVFTADDMPAIKAAAAAAEAAKQNGGPGGKPGGPGPKGEGTSGDESAAPEDEAKDVEAALEREAAGAVA